VTRSRGPLYALFVADGVSLAGNAASRVAIPWFVLETTGSAAITGLAAFFTFLPTVLAAFFGGALVDRLGSRATSVAADLASAGAVALIPALHLTTGIETWQLIALVFLGALLDAPGTTGRAALLPDLAERAGMRLERATGIAGSIHRGSVLLGAPLAGVLIGVIGATSVLWLDAASFLVSAGLVATVVPRPARPPSVAAESRYLSHLLEGVRFIRRDRLLRAVVGTVLLTNFLDAPMVVLYPVFAREAFGSAEALGLMLGTFGGFALLGAAAFGVAGHVLPRRWTYVISFFVVGFVYLGLTSLPTLPLTLALIALAGLAAGPINPILDTVMYERVPAELRGRVLGAVTAGAWAAIPAGTLLGGVVIGWIGVGSTLLAIGICYVLVTGSGFFNPAFREMDRLPEAAAARPAA
jgi:MFS family permease